MPAPSRIFSRWRSSSGRCRACQSRSGRPTCWPRSKAVSKRGIATLHRAADTRQGASLLAGSDEAKDTRTARGLTLTTRLAVAMILLVAIAVLAVGWLSYRSLERAVLPRVLDRIETHATLLAADLQSYVRGARGDVASFR